MQIQIRDVRDNVFSLDVLALDTIRVIKQKIQAEKGHPAHGQPLHVGENYLEDELQTLQDYGIVRGGSELRLVMAAMQIQIRDARDNVFSLAVLALDTIRVIKQKIQAEKGHPAHGQRLHFGEI